MHTPPMPPMHTTPLFLYWYYELTQSAHKDSSSTRIDSINPSFSRVTSQPFARERRHRPRRLYINGLYTQFMRATFYTALLTTAVCIRKDTEAMHPPPSPPASAP